MAVSGHDAVVGTGAGPADGRRPAPRTTPRPPRSSRRRVAGRQAYEHLRAAVRLLHGQAAPADELDRLRREHAEAREQSRRDSLTASYNRRYLDERLVALLDDPAGPRAPAGSPSRSSTSTTSSRSTTPTGTVRRPGAAAAGRRAGRGLPEGAFCARYGGEEFALVLPGRELAAARAGLRGRPPTASTATRGRSWPPACGVTVSIGVAHRPGAARRGRAPDRRGRRAALRGEALRPQRRRVPRRAQTGLVRLAGAAGGRRDVRQTLRVPRPGCDRCGSAP